MSEYLVWLKEKAQAENWLGSPFMIWEDNYFSYEWLFNEIDKCSEFLRKNTLSGDVIALKADYSPYSVAIFMAFIKNTNIVVPITINVEEKVKSYLGVSQAQYLIQFNEAGLSCKQLNNVVLNENLLRLKNEKRAGLILFTSGSTGKPKGALHDLSKLLIKYMGHSKRAMKTLVFLMLDHIGGINTFFSLISNGATMVIPHDRSPEKICTMIEKYKIELLPTTPSFLNLIMASEAYKDHDLSSLQLITYGTEVMPQSLLNKLRIVFPKANLKQTYGLTEVGILSTKSKSSDSTWVKVGGKGYQTKVVDGVLWIKSDTSILGYLNAPSPFTDDGWLITNDRVEVDGDYLRILGREEEIINVGGLKVYPLEVENTILKLNNVKDVIVYGEKNPFLGNIVSAKVIVNKPEHIDLLRKRIFSFCMEKLERYKIPQKIEIVDNIYNYRFKKQRLEIV